MSTAVAVKTPEQVEDERQELNQQLVQANMLRVGNVIGLAAERLQAELEARDANGRYVLPTQAAIASAMVLANTLLTHLRSGPLAFKKRIGAAKKPTVVQFRRVPLDPKPAISESVVVHPAGVRRTEAGGGGGEPAATVAAGCDPRSAVATAVDGDAPEVVEVLPPTTGPDAAMRSAARAAVVREVTAPASGTDGLGYDRGSPEFKAALLAALERAEETK